MVLGSKYNENSILVMFLYFIMLIGASAGIVCFILFSDNLNLKILISIVLGLFILLISYIPYQLYKTSKVSDDIIKYNSIDETITINGYKKKHIIKISDISVITVHNMGMILLISNRIEEGKLYFYLNDGTKIKTVYIDDVYEVYNKLDEIIFKDKEHEVEMKDQVIDKLDGWGSKKEYPSIVSVLVALFVPFFGVWFVSNQKEFKELKNGKATGLMGLALFISALWAIAIIVTFALFL